MHLKSVIGCIFFLYSCASDSLYKYTIPCSNSTWKRSEPCVFNIPIEDSHHTYDVYILLAYTNDFPYQNLYISHEVEDDTHCVLATELSNYILYDIKTGAPLGKGLGSTKTIRLPLMLSSAFPNPGKYSILLTQFMRLEELPGIERVSLQVSKSKAIKA